MANRGKKSGKAEIQKFEYLKKEKNFLDWIKSIFCNYLRAAICWKNKRLPDTNFNKQFLSFGWKWVNQAIVWGRFGLAKSILAHMWRGEGSTVSLITPYFFWVSFQNRNKMRKWAIETAKIIHKLSPIKLEIASLIPMLFLVSLFNIFW